VEGDAPVPLRDGWAAWAQKVSYGWVLGLRGHQFSKQL
jgi:hypothetical protein